METFVTVGQIIDGEHKLCDVNARHVHSLIQSIKGNDYSDRRRMLSVTVPSPANEKAKLMEANISNGVEKMLLKVGFHVFVNGRDRPSALWQLAADVVAHWTLSSRLCLA